MNKVLWMAWFQGENDPSIPILNKHCIQEWRRLNPDWDINVLTNNNISEYVPEFFEIIENSPDRSWAAKSDLLRILSLSKYGGVWVDASVYPVMPLNEFYDEIVNHTKFFTYRFIPRSLSENGNRETVSWFLCVDRVNHPLINLWKKAFVDKFQNLKTWKYFAFHETLCELYDNDNQVKFIIDNMVQIDEKIPHSALQSWKHRRRESYMYKRPLLY